MTYPLNQIISLKRSAGTPKHLKAPKDDDRLLSLDLKPSSKNKKSSVWHVHLVTVPADSLDASDDW